MDNLEGKTAFITGGASGIGLGIAKAFVGAGMNVVIADLRQDHLDNAMAWFESIQKGRAVHTIRLDVTDRPGFAAAADEAEARFGNIHVLVNNAGVGIEGPVLDATYADWDWGVGVNLGGVINGLQAVLPRIVAHGQGGHLVNTASLAGITPGPGVLAIYNTTKAAVVALSESIREELATKGVGVTVLCPGPFKSNIHQAAQNRPEKFQGESGYGATLERLSQRQIQAAWAEPEEAGEMVLEAVRANQLYVITHGEFKMFAEARFKAILDAHPEPKTPDLLAHMGDLARSPPKTD